MSTDGYRTKWRRNILENFNRLSTVHELYRPQTDGPAMTYSERERKFTLAKNNVHITYRIGTVRYNWPMSAQFAHASQAFGIAHCV